MFWKFDLHTSSHLDTLLEREDLSLPELLDEEDVLQECKVVNRKLLDFLLRPPHLQAMVAWVTQEPPASGEERLRYKYPSVACEILTADVPQINDALGADESLLNRLYGFLQSSDCLNPLLASFFSKVMGILINRKTDQLVSFLRKKDDFVDLLLQHIGTSAIMDLLLRLLTCVERPQLRQEVVNWLNEEKIVQRLIEQIHPSKDDNQHSNASQSLCDIIRLSREQMIQVQDSPEPDQLLATLEKQETIEQLLSNMLEGELSPSVLVSGIQVLLTLLEPRRPRSESVIVNNFFSTVDGQLELLAQATLDSAVSCVGALHALRPRLGRFHELLLEPPELEPLCTTWGTLAPPLGTTRLHVVKLLASTLSANDAALTQELLALDVPNTMLDLFFHYVFNNFLHTQVEVCVSTMLSTGPPSDSSLETPDPNPIVKHLLQQGRLVERILTSWEENDRVQSTGGPRKGYMGHLTRMANALVQNMEKGPNSEQLRQLLKELPAEQQEQWEAFVSGPLAETNKKNMVDLVNTHHLHSSSDDEDERLKEFSFPEEAVLQQAFVDFQMQRMTSAFIDHFGFNDEEFGEQEESVNAPFDKTANITFSLHADDENPNANLLEICYKDRIQQFDDDEEEEEEEEGPGSGESDGEDGAWQGRQLARGAHLGPPSSVRSGGSTDSEEEEDEDEDDEEEEEDDRVSREEARPSYPSPSPQPPGPSWMATFDSVPTDALTSPQGSREKEPCSGPLAPQGPLGVPAPSPAGPVAPSPLQLRSQDPTPPSAPQEASDGSKAAELSAPCQALVSVRDFQATLRGTSSVPSSLDSATRDPATSVPSPGAPQLLQTMEGEKSPKPSGLPESQSAQAPQPPSAPSDSAQGGPVSPGSYHRGTLYEPRPPSSVPLVQQWVGGGSRGSQAGRPPLLLPTLGGGDTGRHGCPERGAAPKCAILSPTATPAQPDPLLSRLRCLLPPPGPGRPALLGRGAGQVPARADPGWLPADLLWRGLQRCPAGGPAVLRPRGHLSRLAPGLPLWCPRLQPGPAALHLGLWPQAPAAGSPAARRPGLPPVLRLPPVASPARHGPASGGLRPGPEHHAVAGAGQRREGPLGRHALRHLGRRAGLGHLRPAPGPRPPAGHGHLLRRADVHRPVGLPGPQAQDPLTEGPHGTPPPVHLLPSCKDRGLPARPGWGNALQGRSQPASLRLQRLLSTGMPNHCQNSESTELRTPSLDSDSRFQALNQILAGPRPGPRLPL